MKKIPLALVLLLISLDSAACITCNKEIRDAIFASTFYPNLLAMLSAFIVIAIIVAVLSRIATRRHLARTANATEPSPVPLTTTGMVLGIGIGGFIDGIALHQILQWHEMLTAKMPPDSVMAKSVNMFWDGIFHSFTLLTTILGIYLFWKISRRKAVNLSGKLLVGGMLTGWGLFNLVEGIIDHHILVLHNVRERSPDQDLWNYGFLVFGAALLIAGNAVIKRGRRHPELQR